MEKRLWRPAGFLVGQKRFEPARFDRPPTPGLRLRDEDAPSTNVTLKNVWVANARAANVKAFLVRQGVPEDRIITRTADRPGTLFGLFKDDQENLRRVSVSYDN